jgi:hypothetical protein
VSRVVTWSVVPQPPTELGAAGHPLKGVLCTALKVDSASELEGVLLRNGDRAYAYLQGVLAGLSREPGDTITAMLRDDLTELLDAVERQGTVLLGERE